MRSGASPCKNDDEVIDVTGLAKAVASFIKVQVDQAIDERLPARLRVPEERQTTPAPEVDSLSRRYLKRKDVAEITGYSSKTIARLIATGELRACGIRRDRIAREEVDRMMRDRKVVHEPLDEDAGMDAEVGRLLNRRTK